MIAKAPAAPRKPKSGAANPVDIEHWLRLILAPGQVTELRALNVASGYGSPQTVSGYYNDPEKLAQDAAGIARATGVYFIPNAVDPNLLARAVNKCRPVGKNETSSDTHIVARRWLLIDCDATRPAGIAANDAEHAAAKARAEEIKSWLAGQGWPPPIVADSGNGGHLLYRIDVPPDDGGLVQRCLTALAQRFDDERVSVDQKVFNPARIWKLCGTLAGKGDADAAAIG